MRRHGRPWLRLLPGETEVLNELFDSLSHVIGAEADPDDAITRRLYPAAYPDDDAAETEYRSITVDSLRTERQQRIDRCRADLATGADIDLGDEDTGRRWIQVLNDLRLAIGTGLGITEDDDPESDPENRDHDPRMVYYWLTEGQDHVVHGLMR
jgi:hypothetical protein